MALNFNDWKKNEEASLRNNPGIPGGGTDKSVRYLSDVDRRAKEDADRKGINQRNAMQKSGELMQYVGEAMSIQRGKEAELEELAEEVIRNNYGAILENVQLKMKIVRPGQVKFPEQEEAEEEEQPTYSELNDPEIKAEIDKRKIANNIIQGEGKNTKHILHSDMAKEGLVRIFGETKGKRIHTCYDNITKIMESLDWMMPMEVQERMWKENPAGFAGKCKVEWKVEKPKDEDAQKILDQIKQDEGDISVNDDTEDFFNTGQPIVNAIGVDFPMLLHETVKGIYELIASAGQAEDEEVAKIVSLNADVLSNEIEDLRYGPYIAADLRDFINVNPDIEKHQNLRESVFGKMIVMPANDFLSLMFGILKKTPEARTIVDGLVADCIKELDDYELGQHIDTGSNYEDDEEQEFDNVSLDELGVDPPAETTETEVDYNSMGRRELEALVDQYLEDGKFDEVKKIDDILRSKFK